MHERVCSRTTHHTFRSHTPHTPRIGDDPGTQDVLRQPRDFRSTCPLGVFARPSRAMGRVPLGPPVSSPSPRLIRCNRSAPCPLRSWQARQTKRRRAGRPSPTGAAMERRRKGAASCCEQWAAAPTPRPRECCMLQAVLARMHPRAVTAGPASPRSGRKFCHLVGDAVGGPCYLHQQVGRIAAVPLDLVEGDAERLKLLRLRKPIGRPMNADEASM